jgi:hypothetical protein
MPLTRFRLQFSLSHIFVVQNWADGNPIGTISITGAIAQKYRGPVGLLDGSAGYYKNYVYDSRLVYLQSPYFLASMSNLWLLSAVTDD